MEELYTSLLFLSFINGAMLLATLYYVITSRQTKIAYESMLASQSTLQNQQTIENQLLRDKADELNLLITDIQHNMEKDNYGTQAEINRKIVAIEAILENHSKSWQAEQMFEKKVQESLSNIKQWMKRMGDNPTLIRGY